MPPPEGANGDSELRQGGGNPLLIHFRASVHGSVRPIRDRILIGIC